MNYSENHFEEQGTICLENTIAAFFSDFQVGRLLNAAGIRKLRGASPLKVFAAIFRLPFEGKNFYRGIVERDDLGFGKDAAYTLLRNPKHNWRRLMLGLAVKIAAVFSLLTDQGREKVLIFDSSTYDRSRSKKVELLAWIFDHTVGKSLRGFSLLTLGWSDGFSFLPLDFVLGSSAHKKSRIREAEKPVDKRTCGHRHKREWLAALSTRVDLADEEIIRIHGKRWDIEVCFKMLKQHLRLEKEAQLRDYDGLIGHMTVVMIRYMFLSFRQRQHSDQRTAGSLFHACCEEVRDLTLLEAMQRQMALVIDKIRSTGELAQGVICKMIDAMMGAMAEIMETIRRSHNNKYGLTDS